MAILTDQLRGRTIEHRRARLPYLGVRDGERDSLVFLASLQLQGEFTLHEHRVILHRPDAELQDIVAGIIDTRRQVKSDDIALDLALHAHIGAQAIALDHLKPYRANGTTAGLVPDAAALV